MSTFRVLRLTGEQIGSIDPPLTDDWFVDFDEYEEFVPIELYLYLVKEIHKLLVPGMECLLEQENEVLPPSEHGLPENLLDLLTPEQQAELKPRNKGFLGVEYPEETYAIGGGMTSNTIEREELAL